MLLWAKACHTAVYLQNKSHHKAVEDMTLEEAFTGVKPEVSHLRIFCSPIYVHIPSQKATKLEPSLERSIFVAYNETSKAYKVYIPRQRKIVVRKDVRFDEARTFRRLHGTNPAVAKGQERQASKVEQGPATPAKGHNLQIKRRSEMFLRALLGGGQDGSSGH